ncbi:hypothetical protein EON76_03915 [bacterium]|nr:MAG: hypothetical protein EON76_03915 [bacterium]
MSEQVPSRYDIWAESASTEEVKSAIQELDEEKAQSLGVAGLERIASQQNILEDLLKTKE